MVHHHRPDLLTDCVAALLAGSRVPDEIIVIDNEVPVGAPPPITAAAGLRIVSRPENPGYAASCNTGVEAIDG